MPLHTLQAQYDQPKYLHTVIVALVKVFYAVIGS